MDYPLENLGPDRFQELCQSILAKLMPDLQCFPLFQSDGGRDAFLPPDGKLLKCVVFQVKFVQNPQRQTKPHQQIKTLLEQEIPKIRDLANRGVEEYYLLTNVQGTGTPDSGSIDTTSKQLLENLPIPARCWWRDDICRRLDDAWDIKFSFPEILRSTDIFRLFMEGTISEGRRQRESTLRAFIQDQYERDKELRFKQVELRSELFNLFIDVPVELSTFFHAGRPKDIPKSAAHALARIAANSSYNDDELEPPFDYPNAAFSRYVGAASLLLDGLAQSDVPQLVIEGAPGQGKSTIAQYVCQIHRLRLLGKTDERIKSTHKRSPVRLPFRIDCRDLSAWLSGESPFALSVDDARTRYPHRTVETYLAAQISIDSGGTSFGVNDLLDILEQAPTLIFYDGLDEVADIKCRREVVDAIVRSTNRIRGNALSLQAIVTSRPAVFANSPGLPEKTYPRLHLGHISSGAVKEYANRWLKAQDLSSRESEDISEVLKSKLRQAHIRELARNPMQLSILLSLIRSHGSSLPDMRTTLYDSYIERAFNREAEKSPVVRDYRHLFIDIHRYVAWILHAEAETGDNRGRIEEPKLKELVQNYLTREGHQDIKVEELFAGMVERVVVLVSRVEGTFEFEVQPLREYFAAKYLYVTAPYSPPGRSKGGTKPERFDAMARNFFWHNVTRFYAGCYDRGELPALVESLNTLTDEDGYRGIGYPQLLAATLLSDLVFAQYPRVMKQVIPMVLSDRGLWQLVSGGHRRQNILRLPKDSGNREIVDRCFDILANRPPLDFSRMLTDLIIANSDAESRLHQWQSLCLNFTGKELTRWMEYGLHLGVVSGLSDEDMECYVESGDGEQLWLILAAGNPAFVERCESRLRSVVNLLLRGQRYYTTGLEDSTLAAFSKVLLPQRYLLAFDDRTHKPLAAFWSRYPFWEIPDLKASGGSMLEQKCSEFVASAGKLAMNYSSLDWSTTLEPWKALVSKGRGDFGDQWVWLVLANSAAGIRSSSVRGNNATYLLDETVDLCDRVRYARLQGRAWRWWDIQLSKCNSSFDTAFVLLVFFSWAGRSVFERLAGLVDCKLRSLDSDTWESLWRTLPSEIIRYYFGTRWLSVDLDKLPLNLSTRFVVSIARRIRPRDRLALYEKYVRDYRGDDVGTLEFCQNVALYALWTKPKQWVNWLPVISRTYSQGVVVDEFLDYGFMQMPKADEFPQELVEEIANGQERYPGDLVRIASEVIRTRVASRIKPLCRVAEDEGWFAESSMG